MTTKKKAAKTPKKTPAALEEKKKYFKVLLGDGRSTHQCVPWSLPKGEAPGDWHRVEGTLALCHNGFHLTDTPAAWWAYGSKVYEVEYEDLGPIDDKSNMPKVVVRAARLLREITDAGELAALGIFTSGEHRISKGIAHASGSAQVKAYGSAQVTASGSAQVMASDSAQVKAEKNVTIVLIWGDPKVTLEGFALCIDRRRSHEPPVVTGACDVKQVMAPAQAAAS